jgi:hypothetical protein
LLIVLTITAAAVWWPGCRKYPQVTSPEALLLVKQLYTACNTRHEGRLAAVEAELNRLVQKGTLSPREEQAFRSIVELARAGKWERAERESLRLAEDQLRSGAQR